MNKNPFVGLEWARNNLSVESPHELQERGIQVYFAPNIPTEVKLVNLGSGTLATYHDGEERPAADAYYADFDSLRRYAEEQGLPLTEMSGAVSLG